MGNKLDREKILDEGMKKGDYIALGHVSFQKYDPETEETEVLWATSMYTCKYGLSVEKEEQLLLDLPNTMLFQGYWEHPTWSNSFADHSGSVYSGYCSNTGEKNTGNYRLWDAVPGETMIEARFNVPDGYILKYWFCEKVDPQAFVTVEDHDGFEKGRMYWNDGTNIHEYGRREENIRSMVTCYTCWPQSWGKKGSKDEGRVFAAFREDHSKKLDKYVHNDGTITYGDYDYGSNTFTLNE